MFTAVVGKDQMCPLPKRQGFPLLPAPSCAPPCDGSHRATPGASDTQLSQRCVSDPLSGLRAYQVKMEGQTCWSKTVNDDRIKSPQKTHHFEQKFSEINFELRQFRDAFVHYLHNFTHANFNQKLYQKNEAKIRGGGGNVVYAPK